MARLFGHLLLAFCLLLNGVGVAAAALTMTLAHADHASRNHSGQNHSGPAAPADATQDCPSHAQAPTDTDCCDPGNCDGACAQHAVAALKLLHGFGSEDLSPGYQTVTAPARADPARRRAVRPPIA